MVLPQVSFSQVLNTQNRPFRQNVLDYSHLYYASVLDSFAASFLLLCLTAATAHVAAILLGMTTRSVVVATLLEKLLTPNFFCLFQFCSRTQESSRGKKIYCGSHLIASCFLSILLVVEAMIIYSNSPIEKNVKLEDLRIRWPQISPYNGDLRLKQLPDDCYFFYSSRRSVSVIPLSFCVHKSTFSSQVKSKTKIRVFFERSSLSLKAVYGCETNGVLTNRTMVIALQLPIVPVAVNTNLLVNNDTELMAWLGKRIQGRLSCKHYSIFTNIGLKGTNAVSEVTLNGCEENRHNGCELVNNIVFGALTFSDQFLSRKSFVQFNLNETSYEPSPVTVPQGVDWDAFASFRRSRIPGYILWVSGLFMFVSNILLSAFAPDILLARHIAACQHLRLETIPAYLQKHIKL